MKRLWNELTALSWTLGGTGLVLITLSGSTRQMGIWISLGALTFHLAGVFFFAGDSDE